MVQRSTIGQWRGVTFEVAAWDGVGADVDVSVACMFERELGTEGLHGGLAHLDQVLEGRLTALRRSGGFSAAPMTLLHIDALPPAMQARSVLVVGAGDPARWSPPHMAEVVGHAARWVLDHGDASAALAPSMLDSGLAPEVLGDVSERMLQAVLDALDAKVLSAPGAVKLRRWVFDVGAARFESAVAGYRSSFVKLRPQAPP